MCNSTNSNNALQVRYRVNLSSAEDRNEEYYAVVWAMDATQATEIAKAEAGPSHPEVVSARLYLDPANCPNCDGEGYVYYEGVSDECNKVRCDYCDILLVELENTTPYEQPCFGDTIPF